MSERAIRTVKNLLRKAGDEGKDLYISLLEYRNTPVSGMQESPAQLLMSRMLKSKLPTAASLLQPKVPDKVQDKPEQHAENRNSIMIVTHSHCNKSRRMTLFVSKR